MSDFLYFFLLSSEKGYDCNITLSFHLSFFFFFFCRNIYLSFNVSFDLDLFFFSFLIHLFFSLSKEFIIFALSLPFCFFYFFNLFILHFKFNKLLFNEEIHLVSYFAICAINIFFFKYNHEPFRCWFFFLNHVLNPIFL